MFAVLHVPQFPLQAVLRHEPEAWTRPVVLVDPGLTTPRIVELNRHARAMGVETGFTAPQALARFTEVVVRHRSIAAEESAEAALIQCAYGFSPNVEWTDAGWITLELRGLAELAGEPGSDILASWAGRLHQAAVALGMTCRIGVGPNPTVARHAATAPGTDGVEIRVVTASDAEQFVGSLPVTALEPSPHTARLLAKWGIRTVAEFKALGQAELADRLGLEAFALWAAAAARNTRPLRLVRPPEHYREGCEFDPPIETLEPLLFLLRRFVDSIEHRLEPAGKAVGGLILQLRQESGDLLERRCTGPCHCRQTLCQPLASSTACLRPPWRQCWWGRSSA
jgi:protein ImuB